MGCSFVAAAYNVWVRLNDQAAQGLDLGSGLRGELVKSKRQESELLEPVLYAGNRCVSVIDLLLIIIILVC